ncbi:MAG: hypothetical protein NZ658_08015, partial [Pirellulales bacterium]|nr:hypothetical protein [Pirellulales bacterium]
TAGAAAYCSDNGWADGSAQTPLDARDFLFSSGAYATPIGGTPTTGIEDVDFWNGGLAEERQPFGGYLGSTHNFVFENQIERMEIGDRFYYVARTANTHFFNELESNSFTALVMRNTDIGMAGHGSLSLNVFSVPNFIMEVDQTRQFNDGLGNLDPEGESELFPFWIRDAASSTTNINVPDPTRFLQTTGGDHYTIGGTSGDDTIIGGIGDDSIWGRAGDDRLEGGDGADLIEGGPGDDIITDLGGPDVIEGGDGNDAISSGNEEDVIFGDNGNDFIVNPSELGEIFAGPGNDYILDGLFLGHIRGGQGDDWMENLGGGEDLFQGDFGVAAEAGEPPHKGNDVFISVNGNNDADMENGDDIVVAGPGIDRVEGQLGFDWVSFANNPEGVDIDLDLTIFLRPTLPPSSATVADRYDRVEGVSGSPHADILNGAALTEAGLGGNELVVATNEGGTIMHDGFSLIDGLDDMIPVTERRALPVDPVNGWTQFGWTGGELMLGGAGSDVIDGDWGDDIIDGDAALAVGINTPNPDVRLGGPLAIEVAAAEQGLANATAASAAADANVIATAAAAVAAAALEAADAAVAATDAAASAAATQVALDAGDAQIDAGVTDAAAMAAENAANAAAADADAAEMAAQAATNAASQAAIDAAAAEGTAAAAAATAAGAAADAAVAAMADAAAAANAAAAQVIADAASAAAAAAA